MDYNIKECKIEGLLMISPREFESPRDYLREPISNTEEYRLMGIEQEMEYSHVESYPRGVLRGLNFQSDNPQGILIAVTQGSIYSVAVDLRLGRDYGAAFAVELSSSSERMLYIPPYFAHGFLTLETDTEVVLVTKSEYLEERNSGIVYDDQILAIDWQFDRWEIDEKYLRINQRERRYPAFRNYNANTIWRNPPKKIKKRG